MKRKQVAISRIVPGMVTANAVYTEDNHLVIPKNYVLTPRAIERLEFYYVKNIDVLFSEELSDILFDDTDTSSYLERIRRSDEYKLFYKSYKKSILNVKSTLNRVVTNNDVIDTDELIEDVDRVLVTCNNGYHIFDLLQCIRNFDDQTYVHSLNVALICNVFGNWLKLSSEDLRVLTLSGLLHDIGKLVIPAEILKKPGKLTESEFRAIKHHPISGYNLLDAKDLDERVMLTALMHHERCDKSGYPNGLDRNQISDFGKIVAIADVYDAMTSNRVYREALCPFYVIEIFEQEGLLKYDPNFLLVFLERIAETYIHSTVRLNNNLLGEVIMLNIHSLSKPIIRIGDKFFDLSKDHKLVIEALV